MAEMIDIYDRDRNKVGEPIPRKTKLKPDQFMLYVIALIADRDGRYLVTRRALDKKWAAGAWEIPGGGVSAGETSYDAVKREVLEETGLDISGGNAKVIYSYRNEDAESGDNYFTDIYRCELDFQLSDVSIQEDEVIDVKLASLEDITSLQQEYGFLHYERLMEALS